MKTPLFGSSAMLVTQSYSVAVRRTILLSGALIALVILTALLYTDFARENDLEVWVSRSGQGISAIRALMSNLEDAETGQRGFLLTGDESYLEPYQSALLQEESIRKTLRQKTAGNPGQRALLDTVDRLVEAKFNELRKGIAVRRNDGLNAALAVVRTNRGKRMMDEIRAALRSMEQAEWRLLERRVQTAEAQAWQLRTISELGTGCLLMLLVLAVVVIERDSQKLAQTVQTLASSEERLRMSVEAGAIGIWESDSASRSPVFMDGRMRALYGFPTDLDVDEEVLLSCVHPDDRAAFERNEKAYRDPAGSGRLAQEFRIRRWDNGSVQHMYALGQMFFEGEGNTRRGVRSFGTLQDVTELRHNEEALSRANRELEQFAFAAAHDLQEPLRNVALIAQLLSKRYLGRLDADADYLLKVATDEPLRMHEMVHDLLAFSRVLDYEEGCAVAADSNAALARALHNLGAAIDEKRPEISWDALPAVLMSESHLVQIFQNLVGNSLKYSGSKQPRIHVSSTHRNGVCVFSVQDNGLGIAPQYRDQVFGLFKRLESDRSIPGTGIGLALCKRIVEHYRGKIWIESQPEQGSAFLFTPPVAEVRSLTDSSVSNGICPSVVDRI